MKSNPTPDSQEDTTGEPNFELYQLCEMQLLEGYYNAQQTNLDAKRSFQPGQVAILLKPVSPLLQEEFSRMANILATDPTNARNRLSTAQAELSKYIAVAKGIAM